MQHLSIGAVVKLTGVPAHTLRKWESRHDLAVPVRTETGRRVYTEEHIEQIRLIKMLVDQRHALGQLTGLSTEALRDMANLHTEPPPAPSPQSIALVGETISRALPANPNVTARFDGSYTDWDNLSSDDFDTFIVECDTILAEEAAYFSAHAREDARLILVFRHAPRRYTQQLEHAGVTCVQTPVTDTTLTSTLSLSTTPQDTPLPARFGKQELARIAAMTPGIECECPNHIAQLLMDISSFEQYSQQCVDTDPKEQALHRKLALISAQARTLFEEALVAVTTADGITIKELDQNS